MEPAFGRLELAAIDVDRLERFKASKRQGVGPATMNRILNVLSLVLGDALRRGVVRQNAVALVKRPREPRRSWRILTPAESLQVERAFAAMEQTDDVRAARLLFLTFMGTGMRRGEALGLRWRSVHLADPDGPWLRVEETWTRGAVDTPKSQAGCRTIAPAAGSPMSCSNIGPGRRSAATTSGCSRTLAPGMSSPATTGS